MSADERRPPAASTAPPLSPCILVCQLDASRHHCVGCRRTRDEIRDWPSMTDAQKRQLLSLLPGRRRG